MTLEEKLERFRESALKNAEEESEKILAEYTQTIDLEFDEHKKHKDEVTRDEIKAEMSSILRDLNRELLSKELAFKKEISKKEKAIKNELFDRVKNVLLANKESKEYVDYLCKKIEEANKFAEGDDIVLYIDPSDQKYLAEIVERTKSTPLLSGIEFLGGIRAVIHSKNILIDDSYKTLIDETKSEFVFKGFAT